MVQKIDVASPEFMGLSENSNDPICGGTAIRKEKMKEHCELEVRLMPDVKLKELYDNSKQSLSSLVMVQLREVASPEFTRLSGNSKATI